MRKYLVVAVVILATTAVPVAGGGAESTTGTLNLRGQVPFVSVIASCPPGGEPGWSCHLNTGTAVIAGLGRVSETYFHIAVTEPCPPYHAKMLATSVRLSVAGKGDLNLAMAGFPECLPQEYVPGASPLAFTVTGGTGVYVGASGSGIATRTATPPSGRVTGADTWTGTLVVPGLEFDLTAPAISGARSKVVRAPRNAKRVRVRYRVTATDNVDGSVVVACQPRSGSRFRVGRTIVRCFANDRSGNTATARFTVTVRRSR
jgi:HYR domain